MRRKLSSKLEKLSGTNKLLLMEELFTKLMFKINKLQRKIEPNQANIASARTGILHPIISTTEEIKMYNIDFKALSDIRLGVAIYQDDNIICILKLPTDCQPSSEQKFL